MSKRIIVQLEKLKFISSLDFLKLDLMVKNYPIMFNQLVGLQSSIYKFYQGKKLKTIVNSVDFSVVCVKYYQLFPLYCIAPVESLFQNLKILC